MNLPRHHPAVFYSRAARSRGGTAPFSVGVFGFILALAAPAPEVLRAADDPAASLAAYRAELARFRAEYGGSRELPAVRFFLFGMGHRARFIYSDGRLLDARSGVVVREWPLRADVIVPPDYRVALETADGHRVTIREDENAVWIEEAERREMLPGTSSPVKLPAFPGHPYARVLRVLHQELLVNLTPAGPVPNFFVYSKPWYRDGAMLALELKETGNLNLIRDWILGLREPFDRNNGGETEADNPGQALFLVSLVSDTNHPVVPRVLDTLAQFEQTGPPGRFIRGRSDFAEHPVYQTKWLKFGLRALGLPDPYTVPAVPDSYGALFWMDFRDQHTPGMDADDRADYPYLGWACDHFHGAKKSPISNRDYPLTWERNASQANYPGLRVLDPVYVEQKLAVPHTWHAAEVFLYVLMNGTPHNGDADAARVVDLRPHWDDRTPLANPHKGWYHHFPDNHPDKYRIARDADLLEFPGMDHLYLRLAWSYLEPKEGEFHWEAIDPIITKWTAHGLGIAFRISCRETSTDRPEQQFATPRWVMEAGAQGGHYLMGKTTGPEGPWEPKFDDPIFLAKLDRFLAAFAARYDGKRWLRYVDIGSVGDWGEGHSWAGSRTEVGLAARKAHVDLHRKHFKRSPLVVTDDFVYALGNPAERQALHRHVIEQGISYRDDSILVDGYLAGTSKTFTVRSPEFFADAYLKTPTVLELEHYSHVKRLGNWDGRPGSSVAKHGQGKTGPDYFRGALGLLRATYIGYHGYAHEWLADNLELTGELLNRCGYWYFPHEARLPRAWRPGQEAQLEIVWENRGVAPAYQAYRLKLRLQGSQTADLDLDAGNRRWLPAPAGPFVERYPVRVPANLKPGACTLSFKLHSDETRRDVRLALRQDLLDADGFYRLGTVEVRE